MFQNIDRHGWSNDIEAYLLYGGYADLKKAVAMKPADIVNEVKISGLRGRGGAGFPVRREVGLHQARMRKSRFISSATPTNRSRARSRTATSSTRIRTSSSRA